MTWHVNIRWPFVITAGDGWLEEIGVQSDWSRLQFRFLAASTCVRLGLLIFGVPSTYFPQKKNGEEESRKKVLLSYFTFDLGVWLGRYLAVALETGLKGNLISLKKKKSDQTIFLRTTNVIIFSFLPPTIWNDVIIVTQLPLSIAISFCLTWNSEMQRNIYLPGNDISPLTAIFTNFDKNKRQALQRIKAV